MDGNEATAVAAAVSGERLWQRLLDMAAFGATPAGGVDREALTEADIAARRLLLDWGRERGYAVATDVMGNLFLRREGQDIDAAPVVTGSHLDSQPMGGRFDGSYGVLAGLEVLEALDDTGTRTRRPIDVVSWTNEEGSRFMPGCTGSQVFCDPSLLGRMLDLRDLEGIRLEDALAAVKAALPPIPEWPLRRPFAAFVEAHIEQGLELEAAGKTVGVVTGIQGTRHFEVEVVGDAAHAGTTPQSRRRDAVLAAAAMIVELKRTFDDPADEVRFTIGRLVVTPNAKSVVPAHVFFTIDFRHPRDAVLQSLGDRVAPICAAHAGSCTVEVRDVRRGNPIVFEGGVVETIRQMAESLDVPQMDIFCGAGHDARYLRPHCPTGMILVPCDGGRSHCEDENAKPEDLAAGTRVLTSSVLALAGPIASSA